MIKLVDILKQMLLEEKAKRDRCLRIADRKFDKPSAYKSGAVVRCRQGKIWKGIKEEELREIIKGIIQEDESLHKWFKRRGPKGKEGGWVDCNAPDGKGGYKSCGRKKVKNELSIHHAVLHQLNVNHQVKVKNGVKQND